jgi:chaperonin GroEL
MPLTAAQKASAQLESINTDNFDQKLGVSIIRNAISRPARTIVENAGEEGSVVVGKLLSDEFAAADKFNWGYDAQTSQYRDMIAAGILDPLKVVRTALVDAAGVASLLTTSECCVVDAEEKSPAPGMGMGGMGGMGGMPGMM